MRERVTLYVLGSAALIWPLAAYAQSTTQPTQGTAANSPRIEMVRVKLIDQSAPEPRFQLRDGVIDLTKAVSASAALTGLVPPGKCLPQSRRSTRATGDGETEGLAGAARRI